LYWPYRILYFIKKFEKTFKINGAVILPAIVFSTVYRFISTMFIFGKEITVQIVFSET